MRRLVAVLLTAFLILGTLSLGSAVAAATAVSGTIASPGAPALGSGATAVVLLVDQQAGPTGGQVLGVQRVDDAQWPVAFSLPYSAAAIDPAHSYAVFATVADGSASYQSLEPTPVINGGPTDGVAVTVLPPLPSATSTLPGTLVRSDKSALTPAAVALAALVREDTGTTIAYTAVTTITAEPAAFTLAYDPSLIDPAATYVVRGGILDGTRLWTAPSPVPAIAGGTAAPSVAVPVSPAAIPSPSPSSSAPPSASAPPSPTASATPTPTAAPTAAPTQTTAPSATIEPTPPPSEAPSVSAPPSEAPSLSPTTAPTPTPEASTGTVQGSVTWDEPHVPGPDARVLVALVDGSPGDHAGQVLASAVIPGPGPQPVAFKLSYERSAAIQGDHYRVVAALIDGELAWLNNEGVTVPVPEPAIAGVEVPLTYKPDLLKASVTGTATGDGLDGSASANSYVSVVLVNVGTGQIIGYDAATPIGAAPLSFAVPYSLTNLDPTADYLLNATAWDGTRIWTTVQPPLVITKGNPSAQVTISLQAGPAPTPPPTSAPIVDTATVPPGPVETGGGGIGVLGFMVLLVAITAGVALLSWAVLELRDRTRRR